MFLQDVLFGSSREGWALCLYPLCASRSDALAQVGAWGRSSRDGAGVNVVSKLATMKERKLCKCGLTGRVLRRAFSYAE